MSIAQKLRKFWHDVFYRYASDRQVDLAMKCQDVAAKIDLHEKPTELADRFRFQFHLSLCQSCKNYHDISKVLSGAMQTLPQSANLNIEKLNESLVKRYAAKKSK